MNRDINCINFKGLLAYLRKEYGEQGVKDLVQGLVDNPDYLVADKYDPAKLRPVSEAHLTDPSYWVSNEFSMQLLANVKKVVPGPNSLYKAGEACIIRELSRNFLFFVRVFGIKFLAKQAGRVNAKFNRTKEAKLVDMGSNFVTIELTYKPGFRVTKDVCNWNRGIYAGIGRVSGLKDVKCEEIECVTEGDACCKLKVTWKKANPFKTFTKWVLKKFLQDLLDDYEEILRDRDELIARLKQSKERYQTLTANALTGIYICRKNVFVYVNEPLARMLDYIPNEMNGRHIEEFVHPEDRNKFKDELVSPDDDQTGKKQFEFRALKKDGSEICLEVLATAVEYDGKEAEMGNVIDISERKQAEISHSKLEAQLLQSQKMEAIATLAGGIAHDFNNLLQGVQGYVELILLRKKEGEHGYRELQEITNTIRRGKELTRQLLTLSRKVESNLRLVDLNDEVDNVKHLLERTLPRMIEIKLQQEENLKTLKGDPVQIEQVIMNIAVNARDAMAVAEGGTLTISTENVVLDDDFCRSHAGAKPGEYVMLAISDTGHGMDEETAKRMFDPFYTTKEVGEGTGLGLSTVYGIVRNHGGFIAVATQPGAGTTFKIYFPAVEKIEEQPAKEKQVEGELGGNETILLVDDEDYILEIGDEILTLFGYRVLTRPNGEDALEYYRKKKDRIDLIILDLIMPGLGGKKCLKELLKINPDVKVIITSGYAAVSSKKEIFAEGAKGMVDKPFEMKQLLREIRRVLDE